MKADKALLPIGEEVFLTHAYKNASGVFNEIIFSVADSYHADLIKTYIPKAVTVKDLFHHLGPINGIYSVFKKTNYERFAVAPIDCPYLDYRIPFTLLDFLSEDAAVYVDKDGRAEPLIGAYSARILTKLEESIREGSNGLFQVLKRCNCAYVTKSDLISHNQNIKDVDFEKSLMNFNTPEDYRLLQ